MKKTTNTSMRCLSRLGMLLVAVLFGLGTAKAAPVDLGEIELGKTYDLPEFSVVTGTFTAPATGTLKQVGSADLWLYTDMTYSKAAEVDRTYIGYEAGGVANSYQVTSGTKYYIYTDFNNQDKKVVWYMDGGQPLEIVYEAPESNTQFNFANYKDFTVKYNQEIACDSKAVLKWGTNSSAEVNVTIFDSNSSVMVPVYNTFKDLIANGTVKPNDPFSLTLKNLRAKGKTAGEDKVFNFLMGSTPAVRISEVVPTEIKSYFAPGDPKAVLSMTFDQELGLTDQTGLEFGWGNLEGEVGEYYAETLKPTLSEDKKTISVDFAGVVRTPATMTPLFPDSRYTDCAIKLFGVVDKYGNPVQSEGQGTIGSYSWRIPYTLLERVNIACEFTPANGGSLAGADNIEVYLQPINEILFTGFKITYTDGNETKTVVVNKADAQYVAEGEGGTYTFAIPAEVKGKKNVVVTLDNFACNDGYDHSMDVMATYDSFVILTSDPVNGASMKGLSRKQVITITTNVDLEKYPELYLTYDIEDMNAVDEDHRIVKSFSWFTRKANSDEFEATNYSELQMFAGHTYHMNVTAYQSEADTRSVGTVNPPLGKAYITWFGETAPYQYSDVQFVSITPSVETVLTQNDRVFTVEFDGMVKLDSSTTFINLGMGSTAPFESIEPVEGEDGYSNKWTLTISESFMKGLDAQLDISMVAVDMDGRRVKGTLGEDDKTYFYFTYETATQYTDDFEVVVVGETPYKSVKEFAATSSRGIGRNYNVADGAAVVYSNLQAEVAHVAEVILEQNGDDYETKNTKVTLVLDTEITEPGNYMLYLPQGYFVIDEQFEAQNSNAREIPFSIEEGETPPVTTLNYTVNPEEGNVKSLDTINIIFTDYETVGAGGGHAYLSIDNGTPIQLPDADFGAAWNEMIQRLPQTYTETGNYVITFPAGYFNLGDSGEPSPEFKLTYKISTQSGVCIVPVDKDGLYHVFSVAGIEVLKTADAAELENLPAGLYIINGKKVMVK